MNKVLIIEDEVLILNSLVKMLSRRGVEVTGESSGNNAIELINNEDFDLIICDLMLQDLTGFEVIEASKKKYSSKELSRKFIIMTAYNSEQVIERAQTYGTQVISKPFDNINETLDLFLSKINSK